MYRMELTRPLNYATFDPENGLKSASTPSKFGSTVAEDEEPIWNPFTSSYACRETGFEPGPSGGNSRQPQQSMNLEHEVSSNASLDINSSFTGSSPGWMQDSEQPQRNVPRHMPKKPTEVYTGFETLRTDSPASIAHREVAIKDVDTGDDQPPQTPGGRFAYIGNLVQSWMTPRLRRWLFGAKSSVNARNQASLDRKKSHSRISSSSSSKSAGTSFEAGLSSASPASTNTPRSSLSSKSSKGCIPGRLQQNLRPHRSPSQSDGTRELANLEASFVSPRLAPFVSSHEHEPSSLPETLRQSPSESLFPQPQRAQQQRQQQRLEQEWDTPRQHERGMRQTWVEDETLLLALSLEKEDQAQKEEYDLSQRVAMSLQLQEDREMAERQEILEHEWLQEELQVWKAELETERRTAVETERLQQELRAQEAVLQADAEFAARLSDSNRTILSDREYAERLQAKIEREDAVGFPIIPPMAGYGEQRSKAGSIYDRGPIDQVRNGTQRSQPRVLNDRAFAQNVHEEEKKRSAREEEKTRSEISARQKKTEQGWTTQLDQAQPSRGFQAVRNPKTATNGLADGGECVICTDSFPKTQLVRPCEHFYCRGCLAELFQRAIKDKQQPHCCKRILPLNLVSRQLGAAFVKQYHLFELEITDPNPLYCSNRKCGAFVPPQNIHGDIGVCTCKGRTCRHCRAREHPNSLCAEDEDTQKVEAIGKKKGWKHCPKCGHLIEKMAGCLHMKCWQCKTDFCWNCLRRNCSGTCPR